MSAKLSPLGIVESLIRPIRWLYFQKKPATLSFVGRDIQIQHGHLEYSLRYRLEKGRWSHSMSKKNIGIPVGKDIELIPLEILVPSKLESETIGISELRASIHEALSVHLDTLKNGEELSIMIRKPFATSELIQRKTAVTTPERTELIFRNILPRSIRQAQISLDITEPHSIKDIEVIKSGKNIGQNRYLKLVAQTVQDQRISDIGKDFPNGLSTPALLASNRTEISSKLQISLDFEPNEEIKVIIHR